MKALKNLPKSQAKRFYTAKTSSFKGSYYRIQQGYSKIN